MALADRRSSIGLCLRLQHSDDFLGATSGPSCPRGAPRIPAVRMELVLAMSARCPRCVPASHVATARDRRDPQLVSPGLDRDRARAKEKRGAASRRYAREWLRMSDLRACGRRTVNGTGSAYVGLAIERLSASPGP